MSYTIQENRLTTKGWTELGDSPIALSMAADFTTAALEVLYFDMGALQAVWSGTDSSDGILVVETSLDAVNWCVESGSSLTITGAADNQMYNVTSYGQRYVRLKWTAGATTTGTIDFRSVLKVRR
jgi:hypothetical protein